MAEPKTQEVGRQAGTNRPSTGPEALAVEERYRGLFTECPVALWEEDITGVVAYLEQLRAGGVGDVAAHLEAHPEDVARCVGLIRIVAVNRATLDLYEAPDEQSLLAGLPGVFTAESLPTFREIVVALAAGKRKFEAEAVNRTLQGRRLRVGLRWSVLPDQEGKLTRVLLSVIDLTERMRGEEKIRQSEEFIRSILDTVDEGFIVVDRGFRIINANRAYCAQVGLGSESVLGRPCYELSHRLTRPCYEHGEECAVRLVFATGKPANAVHRHPGAEGGVLYVETKAFPLTDADGGVIAAIETVTNITERYLLEEERLKTQKLESIGALAGGIAHDFNNLLQGVFGYISMAKMSLDSRERSLAMLDQAEKALQLSVNLTTQLLTFSRGGKPVKRRLALGPVIENAARFALSGSRSECRLLIAPDLWPAEADEGQIGQVIQNIVLNADQAMPLGGLVSITAGNLPATEALGRPGLAKGDFVEITIEDQGIGIPTQYLDKIFDPYFSTKEKGSGLGLATSYSIVRNHDGRIFVRSVVGSGTVFTICLPALPDAVMEQARPVAVPTALGGRILFMDDEEFVRLVAGEMLQQLGHEVAFAENGEQALAKYAAARDAGRSFDLVILDLTIRGGMGGAETIRRLRELDPAVKAVVTSGYSDDAVTSSFREHGFRAFLKKPFHFEDLRKTVSDLLG